MSRLQQDGLSVSSEMAQTADEFTQRVRANHYDIILADYRRRFYFECYGPGESLCPASSYATLCG